MPLTAQQVHDKLFTSVRFAKGYDEDEVDAFLDEVEAELDRLTKENDDLRRQIGEARAPVEGAPEGAGPTAMPPTTETEDMLRRTLLLAQRTADEAIAEARAEASKTLAAAREQAAKVEQEAAARRTSMTADLEHHKRSLETQVEALRAFEREYRTRLRAYLEMQLRELERTPAAAPASPLAPRHAGPAPASYGPPAGSAPTAANPPVGAPPPPAATRPFRPSPFTPAGSVGPNPGERTGEPAEPANPNSTVPSLSPPAPEPGDLEE